MPDRDAPVTPLPVDTPSLGPSKDVRVQARRRGAVRTAWTMAGIAFAVYMLFILSGVLVQ